MPPMPPSAQARGPSTFDKLKMGALMGGTVGGIMGFIFGTVTIFQYGAGPAGVMRTLGKYIVGSGATFSCFMGIGSVIRTDSPLHSGMLLRAHRPPVIHPRKFPPQQQQR
ncbi:hypothetical protein GJ744_008216 [Endocarpon pusillum]|uniref:Mitochondrial genome maintenance protein Mgr2 n=1 Tax=Endocarpon pusillum TaxID=364733 RepID=A0A8H7E4Q9_9EURO|nr:hypothetical protein GJ744_008216 [Endocarpon pusillum]